MKPSRFAFAATFAFLAFAIPGNSCGPFFPEAVFVQNSMPDGPYAAYAKGEIGIPQPGYRVQDLVIAYDWLNGHGLSAGEQQQAVALDHIRSSQGYEDPAKLPGFTAWVAARKDSGVPEPPAPPPRSGFHIAQDLNSDRPVPGASYQNFTNCLDEAFAFAAGTLKERKAAHANDPANFADWVHGQDAVFANCNGSGDKMPADTPANAPTWLKQDRAYQQAAAKFYQTDYDGAIARLKTIAADNSSPWRQIASLVEARAMIRRATIGQITDLPAAAVETPNAPYSEDRAKAQRAYADLVKQKRPERLAEARDALKAILADPHDAAVSRRRCRPARLRQPPPRPISPGRRPRRTPHRIGSRANLRHLPAGAHRPALLPLSTRLHKRNRIGYKSKDRLTSAHLDAGHASPRAGPENGLVRPNARSRQSPAAARAGRSQSPRPMARHPRDALAHRRHGQHQPGDASAPELIQAAATVPQSSPGMDRRHL